MKARIHIATIVTALSALACGKDPTAPGRITALPRALTANEQRLIATDNRLAIKLVRQLTVETHDTLPNLFVAPLSVVMALAMTYNGAAGTTEEAMRATLEFEGMSVAEVNESYQSLIRLLRDLDPWVRLSVANSIWYRDGFSVEQPFLDATRTRYDARVEALDFASPAASQTINAWVKQRTEGLIPEIVPPALPEDAMLYVINAIYFKGTWTQQFDRRHTAARPFRLADGSTVTVPTMTHGKEADVRVFRDQAVEVVDLPYGGGAFSMTVVAPRDPAAIDQVVAALTADQWTGWITELDSTASEVYLPKFKLTNDLSLVSTLHALGMEVAFQPGEADFTRMHVPSELFITNVKHKTYVDVNEEGTEAAAATAVEVGVTSVPQPIVVDRPFIVALRENLSGTILFMGVIRNPASN